MRGVRCRQTAFKSETFFYDWIPCRETGILGGVRKISANLTRNLELEKNGQRKSAPFGRTCVSTTTSPSTQTDARSRRSRPTADMSTAATRAIARAPAGRARVPARAPRLSARRRVSSTAALRHPSHLGNTARGAVAPVSAAGGRADEAEPGWYDVPATSNFIDVRSEEELRDVMRAAYGNERASTLLVVEFYGKWCNSCRRLYPRLCKLAAQEQDVLFCKIDFDACKDLCRKLGVAKLPYFHVYNGSGSRLADFAASLDPAKFRAPHRAPGRRSGRRPPRCVLRREKKDAASNASDAASSSLVKLHHVTINWYGGGEDVQIAGDVAGGWTHTLATSERTRTSCLARTTKSL